MLQAPTLETPGLLVTERLGVVATPLCVGHRTGLLPNPSYRRAGPAEHVVTLSGPSFTRPAAEQARQEVRPAAFVFVLPAAAT